MRIRNCCLIFETTKETAFLLQIDFMANEFLASNGRTNKLLSNKLLFLFIHLSHTQLLYIIYQHRFKYKYDILQISVRYELKDNL